MSKGHLELFRKLICFGGANRPFVKMKNIYNNCNLWYTTNKLDMLLLFFCAITQLYVCLYKKNISLPDAKMKLPQCNDIGTSNDGRSLAALPLSSILRQATTVALTLSCRLPQVWARKTERDRPELAGHRGTVIFGHSLQTGSATWKFPSEIRRQTVSAF